MTEELQWAQFNNISEVNDTKYEHIWSSFIFTFISYLLIGTVM